MTGVSAAVRRTRPLLLLLLLMVLATGSGCSKKPPKTDATEISPAVTFERASELLAQRDLRQATAALKKIAFDAETRTVLEPLTRLALADATFYLGTDIGWIDARNLYLDFVTLNGDHPLAPYAQLQVGMCSLKQVSEPSRDQSLTLQAIRDLEAVGNRWPGSPYVVASRAMLREARAHLAESEFLVGRFYFKRKNYVAAIERLNGVVVRFPEYSEADKVLYQLAQAHLNAGNAAQARIQLDRLLSQHPNGEYVARAQKTLGSILGGLVSEVGTP